MEELLVRNHMNTSHMYLYSKCIVVFKILFPQCNCMQSSDKPMLLSRENCQCDLNTVTHSIHLSLTICHWSSTHTKTVTCQCSTSQLPLTQHQWPFVCTALCSMSGRQVNFPISLSLFLSLQSWSLMLSLVLLFQPSNHPFIGCGTSIKVMLNNNSKFGPLGHDILKLMVTLCILIS